MRDFKVIDTFIFGGELEILKMRLDYLYDSVDYFIFSESNKTHNGEKKELTFLQNFEMFEQYKDKIRYVIFEPDISNLNLVVTPENIFDSDLWKLERGQRSQVHSKVMELSDESTLILHSDCDEFPDKTKFAELREQTKDLFLQVVSLGQPTYYYSPLNLLEITWYGTVAFNHQTLINLTDYFSVRENRFHCQHLESAGWHFSFFTSPEQIQYKLRTYAHQEYNTPELTELDTIKYKMYNGLDVLNRPDVKIKKLEQVGDDFPIEFYRHELFFRNTFDRVPLKHQNIRRKKESMQIPLEIENLQHFVSTKEPKVVVEIGTARGGTLARWFELPSAETIITIDFPDGIHGGQGFQERTYVISDFVEQMNLSKKEFYAINGNSRDPYIITRLEELLDGRKIDFLFIDGDHTYEGVKSDFQTYERFLSPNAIVGFHDIINSEYHRNANCYVSTLWKELSETYEYKEFVYTSQIDSKVLDYFSYTIPYGGFGGIGVIEYSKKKVNSEPISLIVPVYKNAESTIRHIDITLSCSNSIKEVIIYSNGSSEEDNNLFRINYSSNPNIKIITKENPIGFIKAVNELFKLAKYENILCMNSDAHLGTGWEEILLPLLKNPNYGVIGPMKVRDFILGCCFMVKKSNLNKLGMLNEGFGLGYVDDVEFSNRVERNGMELGYCTYKNDFDWDTYVNFPIYHRQGASFELLDSEYKNDLDRINTEKYKKFKLAEKIIVLKNLTHEQIKNTLTDNEVYVVFNNSGEDFEKIRYDNELIKQIHLFEITPQMNITQVISSVTNGKNIEVIEHTSPKITWLAKFDDHASMGILSQRVIEKLSADVSCNPIIGATETNNQLIHKLISKPNNPDIGVMFSYPDMIKELNEFKTKVIYTGVDTTGGIPNFAENINNADFILTPSTISKERMESLGVKKPIFVFPHGIDPEVFKYTERIKSNVFKFLYVGECSDRKGIFQLLDAFIYEFKNNENVELHIKSNNDMLFYGGDKIKEIMNSHKNIYWHTGNEGHDYVLELYRSCHAYVYPSRADTFGMTLLEAMACGLPVITTGEPGATELIEGKYFHIPTKDVPVKGHPWMLGEWGEPNVEILKMSMKQIYQRYDYVVSPTKLKEYSDFVCENYSWDKVVSRFESEILPQLKKKTKVLTLLTSYNRPHHIKNIISSLKDIREDNVINDVYIVENSNTELKEECVRIINENIDDRFTLYVSEFNMGQRGALLQMLEDVNLDDYDFIQFTDQDNIFNEPISTYCDILREHTDIYFATGYMSKEHGELGWRKTRFGNLCEKRSLRAGHMMIRTSYLKSLFPLHLDAHYGQPYNSSWNAGLDWEIQYWNPKSIGKQTEKNFVLCVPGGVLHKGTDSTMYDWDVEGNEYKLEELNNLRY
jgi:glycosyltransferase involved in cell wall biosynthesis/GT2 family glycosyltransferase/cephalosporin hydroxylase